jgi:hypothetical protein
VDGDLTGGLGRAHRVQRGEASVGHQLELGLEHRLRDGHLRAAIGAQLVHREHPVVVDHVDAPRAAPALGHRERSADLQRVQREAGHDLERTPRALAAGGLGQDGGQQLAQVAALDVEHVGPIRVGAEPDGAGEREGVRGDGPVHHGAHGPQGDLRPAGARRLGDVVAHDTIRAAPQRSSEQGGLAGRRHDHDGGPRRIVVAQSARAGQLHVQLLGVREQERGGVRAIHQPTEPPVGQIDGDQDDRRRGLSSAGRHRRVL